MSNSETASSRASGKSSDLLNAVAALQRGEVVVFPTETLYGLGADALNSGAVEKAFHIKGRDPNNPFPVLVADLPMLETIVTKIDRLAKVLIEKFWPGPLTIVLPARPDLPRPLLNRHGGIGVRISSEPIATELVKRLGHPLTATSANPSGQAPARTITEATAYFSRDIAVFIDGGTLSSSQGSTVIEVEAKRIKIIRQGAISATQIESVAGIGNVG